VGCGFFEPERTESASMGELEAEHVEWHGVGRCCVAIRDEIESCVGIDDGD
jgi:hypothetical protein